MARIILADRRQFKTLQEAGTYLKSEGHTVLVSNRGDEVLGWIQEERPDVLILSFFLGKQDGFEILMEVERLYPQHSIGIAWIAILDDLAPTTPSVSWDWKLINNFLLFPYTSWQIVLAAQQFIYRDINFRSASP